MSGEEIRGVIDFRGKAIPLYDMRRKMGRPLLAEEVEGLIGLLGQRKQDHLNWIENLKRSVDENRKVTVETDPHRCAFGQWYDGFRAESTNLAHYLAKFDEPHRRIHRLAIEVAEALARGSRDEAVSIIARGEQMELKTLIALFDGAAGALRRFTYEYAMIIEYGEQIFAVAADNVNSFGKFDEIVHPLPRAVAACSYNFIEAIGRLKNGDAATDVLLVDPGSFLQ